MIAETIFQANKNDREKMEVERDLIRTEEKLKEVNAELDTLRDQNAKVSDAWF